VESKESQIPAEDEKPPTCTADGSRPALTEVVHALVVAAAAVEMRTKAGVDSRPSDRNSRPAAAAGPPGNAAAEYEVDQCRTFETDLGWNPKRARHRRLSSASIGTSIRAQEGRQKHGLARRSLFILECVFLSVRLSLSLSLSVYVYIYHV
jgi:hypothetical protein